MDEETDRIFKFITQKDHSNFKLEGYLKFVDQKEYFNSVDKNGYIECRKAIIKTFEGFALFRNKVFEMNGFSRKFFLHLIDSKQMVSRMDPPTIYMSFFVYNDRLNNHFKEMPLSITSETVDNGFTAQSKSTEIIKGGRIEIYDRQDFKSKMYELEEEEEDALLKNWDEKLEKAQSNFNTLNCSRVCRLNKHKFPIFLEYAKDNALLTEQDF